MGPDVNTINNAKEKINNIMNEEKKMTKLVIFFMVLNCIKVAKEAKI